MSHKVQDRSALKNIRNFLGKPIIAYSIESAIKSDVFDEVMVSTDDDEIAEIFNEKENVIKQPEIIIPQIVEQEPIVSADIDIETGRRNQIRVHLSEYGYPIVGDKKYGSKDKNLKRMGLHAYELSFIDPRNNKLLTIHDDIPKEFLDIVK